jgi:putative transposase
VPQPRRRKRLGVSTVELLPVAYAPNRVWAVDFQFDATTDGRPVKIASIVDEHTRECLGGLVARSITADTLTNVSPPTAATLPCCVVTRARSWPARRWPTGRGERTGLAFIPPGQPWCNGYIESFNGRLRDDCLNINLFWSLTQARVVIGDWKDEYNHHRRHSATRPSL